MRIAEKLKQFQTEKSILLNLITENRDNEVIINNANLAIEIINDKIDKLLTVNRA